MYWLVVDFNGDVANAVPSEIFGNFILILSDATGLENFMVCRRQIFSYEDPLL